MPAPAPAHQRILPGVAATLEVTFTDGTGEPAAATGPVTVAVTRADGTTALASTGATQATTGWDAAARYTVTLPAAANLALDELTATWTDTGDGSTVTTTVAVVGGIYCTIGTVRRSDASLNDAAKYPDVEVRRARLQVETEFERVCRRAFVPRFAVERLDGTGSTALPLAWGDGRRVRWVREYDSDGSIERTFTPPELAAIRLGEDGVALRVDRFVWPKGRRNIEIAYEHGLDVVPDDVHRAALVRIRTVLNANRSGVPDRAVTFTSEGGGTFSIATPGMRGSITGIPDVDVVLDAWRRSDVEFG